MTLTPEQMRVAAVQSLRYRQPEQALRLADALLVRDPRDMEALVTRSRALRDLGRYSEAIDAARAAWDVADAPAERYGAALVMAQALSSNGARTRAQWWLRRAMEVAPTDALEAKAVRDFRYVRARNPWSTQLSFNISPSSNINDGSVHDTVNLGGLDGVVLSGTARALSGLEVSGGLSTRYRIDQSRTHKTEIGASLYHETYILSDEARDQAPDAAGSDFAYSSVALTFGHELRPEGWSGPLAFSGMLAWSWYAGEPYARSVSVGMARSLVLGKRNLVRVAVGAGRFRLVNGQEDHADSLRFDAVWLRRLENGAGLRFSAGLRENMSDRSSLDYTRTALGVGYTFAEPILGATATAGLDMAWKSHEAYPFTTDGRDDREVTAKVDLVFDDLDYMGFVPTMSLMHSDTRSTSERHETVETGVSFGIRSRF